MKNRQNRRTENTQGEKGQKKRKSNNKKTLKQDNKNKVKGVQHLGMVHTGGCRRAEGFAKPTQHTSQRSTRTTSRTREEDQQDRKSQRRLLVIEGKSCAREMAAGPNDAIESLVQAGFEVF